ncbi:septum formation protein Maf [Candidatus Beckwithbacteria bacterium CG22_combo_CG10-13_8_21_14_all_01_47_9]|uniref:Nucleoside triphosphate pyrophosphatase n=1 Tax=Candidatus Beckwithbacteria bacterium CG22_combo_CG10-13_8_21_14_all_01_47_9 TaxID=1974496 RepID=A0A2H0E107_9BACT|nr:MAG: septum formation protein Maf [Candidatus Beckwithbacteria bacterium CG22_combo_CG10-13_8_21_14_all_01_47_9]
MNIILASDSPRRKQLLGLMVPEFKAVSHRVNEEDYQADTAEDLVGQLAIDKAVSVEGVIVIGSDLVVATKEMIVSKPKDLDQAREYLQKLSGKQHSVYCGVCVASKEKVLMSVARSDVIMKKYDDKIIEAYIKKFHVLDKGGAYAIQFELSGYGSLVKSFEGGITTIIGLPLDHLENLLKEFEVPVNPDWPEHCKIETGYEF